MKYILLLALLFLARPAFAQTNAPDAPTPAPVTAPATAGGNGKPAAPVKVSRSAATAAELQKTVDQLTQSNRDLLDLLKNQQSVLEDIQFDRRLQSRQIQSLEGRLEEALFQNSQLQRKIDTLEADAAVRPPTTPITIPTGPAAAPDSGFTNASPDFPSTVSATTTNFGLTNIPPAQPVPDQAAATPPPPSTYLPPPDTEGAPGTKSWHRLFTLKGDVGKQSDLFQVQGRTWRVVWHNQDKPGKEYLNTSALFINAFPKDDTIPQKVCSKLGSGGDSTELEGPGNYYLKIEASGGSWELAVEDFR